MPRMHSTARLNNRKMIAIRKDIMYEAIMTDLYLIGALEKEIVEKLIGRPVSEHLTSPIGNTVNDE
jgi:hypothetical protein